MKRAVRSKDSKPGLPPEDAVSLPWRVVLFLLGMVAGAMLASLADHGSPLPPARSPPPMVAGSQAPCDDAARCARAAGDAALSALSGLEPLRY